MPGPFFTRPNFEDRQVVQYSGTSITLSGNTNINPTGNFRIYKDAFPGLVATSLDADGTVVWGPISGISWSISACTSPLYVNHIIACPSTGDTIQIDAGNLALNSELNFLITLSAGTTTDNVLVVDSSGYVKSVPQSSITPVFTGGTGSCITDLYVTNIHGCSPINIQPTSPDDVYMVNGGGNVGIGVISATTKLHISGDTIVNSDYLMLSDTLTTIPSLNFKGFINTQDSDDNIGYFGLNLNSSGETGLFIYNESVAGGGIQTFGSNHIRDAGPHVVGSDFYRNKILISANNSSDGMVIKPKADDPLATLWFEMDTASVMILKGDGTPGGGNAFLGIALNPDGTEMPTSNLQIGGTGTTGTFQYRDGNQQNGYVLTSDADGNATWQVPTGGGGGGTFTGNTSASCITDLYLTNIYGCGNDVNIISTTNITGNTYINGTLYATSKSFSIPHPLDENKLLVYGSLEGPENGVYHRGKLIDNNTIQLPDYWSKLVDINTVTVNLTPNGKYQNLFVKEILEDKIIIDINNGWFGNEKINCFYTVYGERKDIDKLKVER